LRRTAGVPKRVGRFKSENARKAALPSGRARLARHQDKASWSIRTADHKVTEKRLELIDEPAYGLIMSCRNAAKHMEKKLMKIWNKPQVSEQAIGLEVTSYLPAEIDII
jgi:coenzyme PQQ precursor peptide PqqA